MPGLQDLPGQQQLIVAVPGQATAATPDEFVLATMPFNGTVTSVSYLPKSTVTGAATNFLSVTCRNRGPAGAGATNVAQLDYSSGAVVTTAFAPGAVTLNATAANRNFSAGDVLTCEKLVAGTGLAMPAGTVIVNYTVR